MGGKKREGTCAICGLHKKLTFEHIPPRSAFNKRPVFIKDHRHLLRTDEESFLYGKKKRSNQGLGGFYTCSNCNNNTGGWYSNEYKKVAERSIDPIKDQYGHDTIHFSIRLKPLNFLKQVIIHHLCCDKELGEIRRHTSNTNFILNRTQRSISSSIRVFMYCTFSKEHRMLGISAIADFTKGSINNWSEFNFHPFGTVLAIDSQPPRADMMEITYFKQYEYDEVANVEFALPYLNVGSSAIGTYSR